MFSAVSGTGHAHARTQMHTIYPSAAARLSFRCPSPSFCPGACRCPTAQGMTTRPVPTEASTAGMPTAPVVFFCER